MYCRKCGKEINYDAEMCVECQENEELFRVEGETQAQESVLDFTVPTTQDKGSRMTGFGLALAGAIVSEFAILFSYLMFVVMSVGSMGGVLLMPFSAATSIFSLVAGLKSLKTSKNCVNEGKVKPIPTFIMGIISVVSAGLSFFIMFLAFVMVAALTVA